MSLLNKKEVKRLALAIAEIRSSKFTRVSQKFIDDLDLHVENMIKDSVRNHPSVGKTIVQVYK